MILIYEPDGGPAERLDLDDLSAVEAVAIEQVVGLDWDEIETELKAQKPGAMLAALYAFRKRSEPDLKSEDFDVPGWRKRLRVRLTQEEIREHVADVARQIPDAEDPNRQRLLHLLRKVAENPDDVDTAAAPGGGKARAPKGGRARAV